MKKKITLVALIVCTYLTAFAHPLCQSVDLEKAQVRDVNEYGTAEKFAGESISLGGASSVSICRSGPNLVVITRYEILSGNAAGTTTKFYSIFSK
jgi:hypothetical protein